MQRRATARTAAGSSIQSAVRSALETLENRQMFAAFLQPGTDAGITGTNIAWQAETGGKLLPDAAGNNWRLIDDANGKAMGAPTAGSQGADGLAVTSPGILWNINFPATTATYRLYVRRTISGGNNSFWAPSVDGTTGVGVYDATKPAMKTATATNTEGAYDNVDDNIAVYTWAAGSRNGNNTLQFQYTVTGPKTFEIHAREGPNYVIDRMILSTNLALTPEQLDTIADSNITHTVPDTVTGLTGIPNGNTVNLAWQPSYDALTYIVERSDLNTTNFTQPALSQQSDLTFLDTAPTVPGTYTYRITPVNGAGNGTPTTVTVNVNGSILPPTGFRVSAQNNTAITLSWDRTPNTSGYSIFRAVRNADGTIGAFALLQAGITDPATGNPVYVDNDAADNGAVSYVYQVASENLVNGTATTGAHSANLIASTNVTITGGQGWSLYANDFYDTTSATTITDSIAKPSNAEYIGLFNQSLSVTGGGEQTLFPTLPSTFNPAAPATPPQPVNNGPGHTFTITFKGKVTVPSTANWVFYTRSDDGIKLTVDGVVLRDLFSTGRGIPAAPGDIIPVVSGGQPVTWLAGSTHDVELNWEQGNGGWDIVLGWAPNGDQSRIVQIPTAAINPVAPQAPVATGAPNNQAVQINWTQVDAQSYKIQQRLAGVGSFVDVAGTTTAATSATNSYAKVITGLTNGTAYDFQVIATNANGTSTSNIVTLTPTPLAPTQPTGLKGSGLSFTAGTFDKVNVNVTWTATPFATTYKLERAEVDAAGNPGAFTVLSDTIATNSYNDSATVGKKYVYRVTATNVTGSSPVSANSAVVNLLNGAHEYRYMNSSGWKSPAGGYRNPGVTPDFSEFRPNVNSPRDIAETFSRVYTGKIHISQTGDYTFATNSDDDSYLMIDGKLVANLTGWGIDSYLGGTRPADPQPPTTGTPVSLSLTAGQEVDFIYWQEEGGGGDFADMRWQATNLTGAVEAGGVAPGAALSLVPSSQFRILTGAPTVAPTNLTSTGVTATTAAFSYVDGGSKNELHFLIERAPVDASNNPGAFVAVNRGGLKDNTDLASLGTFTDAGLLPGTKYAYRVRAENFEGVSAPSNVVIITTSATPAPQPGGKLTYYDNQWWGSPNQSTAGAQSPGSGNYENQITITDQTTATAKLIDFHSDDQNGQLAFGPAGDDGLNYSIVISGKLIAPETGSYKFITQSDDDSYFVVNGKLVSQWPGGHGEGDTGGMTFVPITLTAGQEYNYQYYMSEGGGGHGFHARWVIPSDTTAYGGATGGAGYEKAPLIPMSTGAGVGGFSTDTETTPAAPTLPAGGAAAVYSEKSATSVKISFTDNAVSEVRYVLERSSVPTFATIDAATDVNAQLSTAAGGGAAGAGSITVFGLTAGTTYYFRIRASNYDGQSANLDLGSVTTLTLSSPGQPLARVQNNGDVTLTWNDVLPLGTKVSVSRSTDGGGTYTELTQVNQIAGGGANTYTDTGAKTAGTAYKYRLQTIGGPGGTTSPTIDVPFTVLPKSAGAVINYSAGFPTPPALDGTGLYAGPSMDLQFNGNANSVAAGMPTMRDADGDGFASIRLTDTNAAGGQASTVWSNDKVTVTGKWMTQFDFLATNVAADGFVFALQNNSKTFVGGGGGSGGYNGIGANAVGIGFDTYNNISTTGAYIGDAGPTSNDEVNDPYVVGRGTGHGLNLNPGGTGVDLHGGRNLRAIITYDGTNLSEMVVDLDNASRVVFNYNYGAVNLQTALGGDTAWVGFTGATGGAFENVDINNWVFSNAQATLVPSVASSVVGDASGQRSMVKQISVTFDTPINTPTGAMKLLNYAVDAGGVASATSTDISAALNAPTSTDNLTWVWTFVANGANTENSSLKDGVYSYTLDKTKVVASVAGGQPMATDFAGAKFHRLFGDINNSKSVNNLDFGTFKNSFLKPANDPNFNSGFDFDNSGSVNNLDFGQFKNRFLKTLTYT